MIEAVNSVIANASSLRASAEVVSTIRTAADIAPVVRVDQTAVVEIPKAPYISPYFVIDRNYNKAVLQIRNSDTGDVVQQFPTESRLAQMSHAQQLFEKRQLAQQQVKQVQPSQPQPYQVDAVKVERTAPRSDIVSVQEVTSAPPANNTPSPQAIAAFSAGAQTAQAAQSSSVTVIA